MLDVGEAFGDADAERLAPTGETVDLAETTIESCSARSVARRAHGRAQEVGVLRRLRAGPSGVLDGHVMN